MYFVKHVTATGADDSVDGIEELFSISEQFPQVEWGILVSRNNAGCPRFPSMNWLQELSDAVRRYPNKLNLSVHLCGTWVRQIFLEGKADVFDYVPMDIFKRVQFNFHAQHHHVDKEAAVAFLKEKFSQYELIFQCDGVNDALINLCTEAGLVAYPLYDQSGGAGIIPDSWPTATGYSGYAGGLSPANVVYELLRIEEARNGYEVWVDAETKLRCDNDRVFDLDLVSEYVRKTYQFVWGEP